MSIPAKVEDEIYTDNYYDYQNLLLQGRNNFRSQNSSVKFDEETTGTMFRVTLTILLRVGFLLVQIGSVPVSNVNLILLQNIIDFSTVTAVSILVGFVVSFTGDVAGLIGEGIWIGDSKANINEALIGWCAAVTASAICTCCISGRMHAIGYLLTGIIISGIIQPFLIHWAWTPRGWMADNYLKGKEVSFKDYAGGGLVHVVGGLAGFLGCVALGRRILRLRDIDDASLPEDSPGSVFAGYFFIFLGLQGLQSGIPISEHGGSKTLSRILANNLLAASSSSLLIIALHFALSREAFNYWTVTRCIQGGISGVVAVAAGLDVYSPLIIIAISWASGLIFYLVSRRVYRSALEDNCNIVATHLACALFGIFMAPICGKKEKSIDKVNHEMILDVAWQVICILTLLSLIIISMGSLFVALELFGYLRNRSELTNHRRATIALERGPPRSYMQRLFFPGIDSLYLEPCSIAKSVKGPRTMSPRLWKYEQEIKRIENNRSNRDGGSTISEARESVVVDPNENSSTVDIVLPRIKKPRQIHTLTKDDHFFHEKNVKGGEGGTGESMDDGSGVSYAKSEKINELNSMDDEDDNERLNKNFTDIDHRCGDRDNNFSAILHRTSKSLSLRSSTPNEKIDYLKQEEYFDDNQSTIESTDFNVKVILKGKNKSHNYSSDSDDERRIVDEFKIRDKFHENLNYI